MPKRLLVSIVVVCLAALGAFFFANRDPGPAPKRAPAPARASGAASAQAPALPPAPPPETRVRKLSAAERRQLAERIAAARVRARAAASAGNPLDETANDDDSITLEQVSPTVRESLEQAIPILAECFRDKQPKRTAVVLMTMYSNPSVGMVIDTEEMTDEDGQPLPAELDDCLRTTIDSLGLPPLDVGGHLPLQYSYKFDATGSSR